MKKRRLIVGAVAVATGLLLSNNYVQTFLWLVPEGIATSRVSAEEKASNVHFTYDDMPALLAHYQRVLQILPADPNVRLQTADCLVDLGRFDEARITYQSLNSFFSPWKNVAKSMLAPGAMVRAKASFDESRRNVLVAQTRQLEAEKLRDGLAGKRGGRSQNGKAEGLSAD